MTIFGGLNQEMSKTGVEGTNVRLLLEDADKMTAECSKLLIEILRNQCLDDRDFDRNLEKSTFTDHFVAGAGYYIPSPDRSSRDRKAEGKVGQTRKWQRVVGRLTGKCDADAALVPSRNISGPGDAAASSHWRFRDHDPESFVGADATACRDC